MGLYIVVVWSEVANLTYVERYRSNIVNRYQLIHVDALNLYLYETWRGAGVLVQLSKTQRRPERQRQVPICPAIARRRTRR